MGRWKLSPVHLNRLIIYYIRKQLMFCFCAVIVIFHVLINVVQLFITHHTAVQFLPKCCILVIPELALASVLIIAYHRAGVK